MEELRKEFGAEAAQIPDTAERGITLQQLKMVCAFVRVSCWRLHRLIDGGKGPRLELETLNLYDLTTWVIKPATERVRLQGGGPGGELGSSSFVELLLGLAASKAGAHEASGHRPEWFISHWWGEAIWLFVGCIVEHCRVRGHGESVPYWCCAYANNQHDLGKDLSVDPRKTSFFRAMQLCIGVLVVLDPEATPFKRMWCCFEEAVALGTLGEQSRKTKMKLDIVTTASVDAAAAAELPSPPERTAGEAWLPSVVLTDGLTAEELEVEHVYGEGSGYGWVKKRSREAGFPMELIENHGLQIDIERAAASREEDKTRILNAIAGREEEHLDDPVVEAHPRYLDVSRGLRSIFAIAAWPHIVQRGSAELLREFAAALRGDSLRKSLEISCYGVGKWLTDNHVRELAGALPPQLESLQLSFEQCSDLTNNSMAALVRGLPLSLTSLSLSLRHCYALDDAGLATFAEAGLAGKLCALQVLSLNLGDCHKIGNAGLAKLAACLPNDLKELHLTLASCRIDDRGMAALALGLPSSLRMLYLDTYGTGVSDKLKQRCYLVKQGWSLEALRGWRPAPDEVFKVTSSMELVWQMSMVLDGNADLEERDADENTCLAWAIAERKCETVRFLLAGKASLETRSGTEGITPLGLAIAGVKSPGDVGLVQVLLDAGANACEPVDRQGLTALHCLATSQAGDGGPCELLAQALLRKGAPLEATTHSGHTPLLRAALYGRLEVVTVLVNAKAHLEARANNRCTALHLAASRDFADIVGLLLKHGARADAQGYHALTPLHCAAAAGSAMAVGVLLQGHADAGATCINGGVDLLRWAICGVESGDDTPGVGRLTALQLAQQGGHTAVVESLQHEPTPRGTRPRRLHRRSASLCEWFSGSRQDHERLIEGVWKYSKGGYVTIRSKPGAFIVDHPSAGRSVVPKEVFVRQDDPSCDSEWSFRLFRFKGKLRGADSIFWDVAEEWERKGPDEYLAVYARADLDGELARELGNAMDEDRELDEPRVRDLLKSGADAHPAQLLQWSAYQGQTSLMKELLDCAGPKPRQSARPGELTLLECAVAGATRGQRRARAADYEEVVRHLLASGTEVASAEAAASALQFLAARAGRSGGSNDDRSAVGVSKLLVDRLLQQARDLDQFAGSVTACAAALSQLRAAAPASAAKRRGEAPEAGPAANLTRLFRRCDVGGAGTIPLALARQVLWTSLGATFQQAQLEEIVVRFRTGDAFRYQDLVLWLYPPSPLPTP